MVNHLGRLFVTSDAATIIREIEVVHPAAKLLVMASQAQEAEMGDATNTVLILAGELLKKAENLLVMGLHPSEIVRGYELACGKALAELESACAGCPGGAMLTFAAKTSRRASLIRRPRNRASRPHSSPRSRQNNMVTRTHSQRWWRRLLSPLCHPTRKTLM